MLAHTAACMSSLLVELEISFQASCCVESRLLMRSMRVQHPRPRVKTMRLPGNIPGCSGLKIQLTVRWMKVPSIRVNTQLCLNGIGFRTSPRPSRGILLGIPKPPGCPVGVDISSQPEPPGSAILLHPTKSNILYNHVVS